MHVARMLIAGNGGEDRDGGCHEEGTWGDVDTGGASGGGGNEDGRGAGMKNVMEFLTMLPSRMQVRGSAVCVCVCVCVCGCVCVCVCGCVFYQETIATGLSPPRYLLLGASGPPRARQMPTGGDGGNGLIKAPSLNPN